MGQIQTPDSLLKHYILSATDKLGLSVLDVASGLVAGANGKLAAHKGSLTLG